MSIEAMPHLPYTDHRDYVALSADLAELPHDCGDGSTCIMSDTEEEYVFHKPEDVWKKEKRPIPELAYRGETDSVDHCYPQSSYGDMQLVRKTPTNVYMVYWNGIKWQELKEEEED